MNADDIKGKKKSLHVRIIGTHTWWCFSGKRGGRQTYHWELKK